MRVIVFRGKSLYTGEWLFGSLVTNAENGPAILHKGEGETVGIETIGEYTSLEDKNGVGIYEGDIVEFGTGPHEVTFDAGCFYVSNGSGTEFLHEIHSPEIIGNIHDDPELTETEKDPTATTVES